MNRSSSDVALCSREDLRRGWSVLAFLALAVATVSYPAPSVFAHGPFAEQGGEASWEESFVAPKSAQRAAAATGPSALVALNAAQFRPGHQFAMGVNVQNPFGGVLADLFVGAILPDKQTLVVLSSSGSMTVGSLTNLSGILPTQAAPPGFTLNAPGFFQFTFPGIPVGTYQVFAVLLRQGALANNQIDPGEILAVDTKTFTFSTGPPSGAVPFLQSPFTGQYRTGNFFDHFYPKEFINPTGLIVPYWGEQLNFPVSSDVDHEGYDFILPEGTPVIAAAGGSVVVAGLGAPFVCPPLGNAVTQGLVVLIDHVAPNGVHYQSGYQHLSRVDVQVGQSVLAGQPVGLSGNTGCSDSPHLHYEVFRVDPVTRRRVTTDPYGWEGSSPDPWAVHPEGVESVWLWRDGAAPVLFRERRVAPNPSGSMAPVTLTALRWIGVNDAQNPNNEFVEITLDSRYVTTSTFDLTGFSLRNNRGDTFNFPPGLRIQVGRPILVHTGPGVSTDTELFWGSGAGVWDNTRECVRLVYPTGGAYRFATASDACD